MRKLKMAKSNKDWSQDREGAYNFVFLSHKGYGSSVNSGKGRNGGYYDAQRKKGREPLGQPK